MIFEQNVNTTETLIQETTIKENHLPKSVTRF